jgi:transcriptional regulator with XRE-family HTH domain
MLVVMRSEEEPEGTASEESSEFSLDRKIGEIIREERIARDLTAEEAARRAKVAYKTWQRIEHGWPVRGRSLSGVDRLFGLPLGTTLRARDDVYGLDLRAEIRQAARTASGTAELDLSARGRSHVDELGRAVETDAAGSPNIVSGRANANLGPLTASAHGEAHSPTAIVSGQGRLHAGMTTAQLLDLVMGLDLDDLRRLCDLANGALQTREHPDIEKELLAARDAREHADKVRRATIDQLDHFQMEVTELTYRLQSEKTSEADKEVMEAQLRSVETAVMQSRESYAAAQRMAIRAQDQYYILSKIHAQIQKFRSVEMARDLKEDGNG